MKAEYPAFCINSLANSVLKPNSTHKLNPNGKWGMIGLTSHTRIGWDLTIENRIPGIQAQNLANTSEKNLTNSNYSRCPRRDGPHEFEKE